MAESTKLLGLLLTDGFALMSYASVIEAYRAANRLSGETLYRWVHLSPDGAPVRASSGGSMVVDQPIGDDVSHDILFVFAGGEPREFEDAATFAWLRRQARRGAILAGVSGGPFLLARAGLLDGFRATIHWEHRDEFVHRFPDVATGRGLYVVDRNRVTCAGGTAGLDLALDLIGRDHGPALAHRIADWFVRTEPRGADTPQRTNLADRYGVRDERVLRALNRMEESIEAPLAREALAQAAGVSLRQLERLVSDQLGRTIAGLYRSIRLAHARDLLLKTGLALTDVALMTGFHDSSHFSRAFSREFDVAPSKVAAGIGSARDRRDTKAVSPRKPA